MRRLNYIQILEISVVILLSIYFYLLMSRWGTSWDNIAGYYNTLTMAGKSSYYEILREPLVQLILLPGVFMNVSLYQDILFAQIVFALFFLFCTKKLARSLKIDLVSAYLILLSAFVIQFMFSLNITDIFGFSTAMLAFAYYFDKDFAKSSVVFGLSFLAKFTNLIFLPCMLFMFKGKWRVKSIAIAFIVNVPWFIANFYLYGNPIYGFELSNQVFSNQHVFTYQSLMVGIGSLISLLTPIIILTAVITVIAIIKKQKKSNILSRINRIDIIVLGFALFESVYVGSAQNYVQWLMYPLFLAVIIIALKALSKINIRPQEAMIINTLYFALFLFTNISLIYYVISPYNNHVDWQLWFSKNPSYNESLRSSALYGCHSVFSNAWPYLMVYNSTIKPLQSINTSLPLNSCFIIFNTTNVGIPINLSDFRYVTLKSSTNYTIVRYYG